MRGAKSQPLAEIAVEAAHAGATELLERFRRGDLAVRAKAPNDFVSEADHASERAILAVLRDRAAGHGVLAEEKGVIGGELGSPVWIVDPLDGTTNYLHGLPVWGVSVACFQDTEVIAGAILEPLGGELFVAERGAGARWNDRPMRISDRASLAGAFLATGYPFKARGALDAYLGAFRAVFERAKAIRRCGAAVLDLAYTAAGVFDGFFEFRLAPWDLAAGSLMIEEAGGVATDLDGGRRYLATGNLVAGTPAVQHEMRQLIADFVSESVLDELAHDAALEGLDVLGF